MAKGRGLISESPATGLTGGSITAMNTEGIVESVEDIVSLISPYDTPFYSMLRKEEARDVIHYWQEDDLAAASRSNAQQQGYEPTSYDTSTPGMKANYTQLVTKTARVSGTGRSVTWYGRGDELDYQILKRGREIKRDIEAAMLGEHAGTAPTTGAAGGSFPYAPSGTGGRMTSASYLIHTAATTGNAVDAHATAPTVHTPTSGVAGSLTAPLSLAAVANAALTELAVLTCQKQTFNNGGNPNVALVSPFHAATFANFAYIDPTTTSSNGARNRQVEDGMLVNYVDVYKSPYGTLSVVIDRFIYGALSGDSANEGIVLLLETDKWHCAQLRDIQTLPLAKTGDNDKALVLGEMTLVHENTKSSGVIRQLTTS